jgi:hypothetical protein
MEYFQEQVLLYQFIRDSTYNYVEIKSQHNVITHVMVTLSGSSSNGSSPSAPNEVTQL